MSLKRVKYLTVVNLTMAPWYFNHMIDSLPLFDFFPNALSRFEIKILLFAKMIIKRELSKMNFSYSY